MGVSVLHLINRKGMPESISPSASPSGLMNLDTANQPLLTSQIGREAGISAS